MSYFVFDLDETLSNLSSVYYHIITLKMKKYIVSQREYMELYYPAELHQELEKAYDLFVNAVLKEEQSDKPLGILRPGILEVMTDLAMLKQKRKIMDVIIYSNNSHLESIQFVRDLINRHVGMELIKECISRFHPIRFEDNQTDLPIKTWLVLKRILVEGNCKAPRSLEPKHIYFFDDLRHMDLEIHLKERYYRVSPYTFRASLSRINALYEVCLREANVSIGLLLMHMIDIVEMGNAVLFTNPLQGTMQDLLDVFEKAVGETGMEVPRGFDVGILMMNDAIQEAEKWKRKRRCTVKQRRYTVRK
uniref:Uncharacterized protein n=1 Tax=viral metagenome TaxID=1070528 RepID=A0A6C0KSQ3_9ZZZZ